MRAHAFLPLSLALATIGTAWVIPQAQAWPAHVCFYEHANFGGRSFCIRVGRRANSVGTAYNDIFSSVRIPPGVRVTICEHDNFRGRCRTLHRSANNFDSLGFNDMVSSVAADEGGRRHASDRRDNRHDRRRSSACFYEHANFGGSSFCIRVGQRANSVGVAYNDIFSSVRIPPGVRVTICEHDNFRGRCRTLRRSENNFEPLGFNDMVSSVAAEPERGGGHWRSRDRRHR